MSSNTHLISSSAFIVEQAGLSLTLVITSTTVFLVTRMMFYIAIQTVNLQDQICVEVPSLRWDFSGN